MAIYFHSDDPPPPSLPVFRIAGNCHHSCPSSPPPASRRSHSAFYLLLALRADIIILECLCVDKLTKRNSFLSCCSSLASSSPWSSVFFIAVVVGIVIIFYAKSNKVNKNIAKKHTHTKQTRKKRETARRFGLVVSCLLVCYAGNLVAIKECLRFIDFILVHSNTHTRTRLPIAHAAAHTHS